MKRPVAMFCVALAVAGCSSDDGGGSAADDTAATTAATAVTTTTVPGPTPDDLAAAVCAAQPVRSRDRVTDPAIAELSGLVALDSGWWAHNDSGDSARIFRLAEDGSTQAVVNLEGIEATDWEDMTGAGPTAGELFVGDIGDNDRARPEILVQHLTVPDPVPVGEVTIPTADVQTITLHYPNGPRDAETILVDPLTRDLVIVHKVFGGDSELYVAPEDDWSDGDANLQAAGSVVVGRTPLDATTSGDIGFEGQVVALRTYARVLVFARQADQTVAEALDQNPSCTAPTRLERQGEAIAFTPEGYVTISEGERPRINRFAVTVPEVG